ncbi:MAG TPA: right-handed parallel beta-helix repeat-containing protein [Mycobacteriales bacterium]|jgi:hypothetical protein|nr:right-handed parallel beta-helix repeat-containing protein [Mycobacteriales bacterium]
MTRLRLPLALAAVLVSGGVGAGIASAATPQACSGTATRVVSVHTVRQLHHALAGATAGTQVRLADGVYRGTFELRRSGTGTHPIVVCGTARAVIDAVSITKGVGLRILDANHVAVRGISLRHGQKALEVDGSTGTVLDHLAIHATGMEGVVIRRASSGVVLSNSRVWDTGQATAEYGEAVYIGTAKNNWCDTSPCTIDRTDGTRVVGNVLGPGVRAEEIDVKEGTSNGTISHNTFDGRGMTNANAWVDVKGNSWSVTYNTGRYSRRDGFGDNCAVVGWGNGNLFAKNIAYVYSTGYGFRVGAHTLRVRVLTNNIVWSAASGVTNITETPA